jgi:RNA polymerase sigma-70 factor (ECF subfamily)
MKLAAEMELAAFDERLVGEAEARPDFEHLYARYGASVLRWAKHLAGPTLDAEDIAQEVFYRAYCQQTSFRGNVHPCTWLYRIAANVVTSRRNRERRKVRLSSLLRRERPIPERTPEDVLERDQRRAQVYEVLNTMRERDRTLLIAFGIEGLSGREIADLFGMKLSTVWTWLYRARMDFRRRLINRGVDPGDA